MNDCKREIILCGWKVFCEAVSYLNMVTLTALPVSAAAQRQMWIFWYEFFKDLIHRIFFFFTINRTALVFRCTLSANRSLSRLCPIRMDSALNMLSSTACTSLRVMVVFSRSSCVTPENLEVTQTGVTQTRKTERQMNGRPLNAIPTVCCNPPLCCLAWQMCHK